MEYHAQAISQICKRQKISLTKQWLYVSVAEQEMYFYVDHVLATKYAISTAKKGISQIKNSKGTPLGLHVIAEKMGLGAPNGTVFIARKNTKKLFTEYVDWCNRAYVITRILRLRGLQPGFNLGGKVDTYDRYIYIHGVIDEDNIGRPQTGGCIGMLNADIMELFERIPVGTMILISEK